MIAGAALATAGGEAPDQPAPEAVPEAVPEAAPEAATPWPEGGSDASGAIPSEFTPPNLRQHYLRYGVGLNGEFVVGSGKICPDPDPAPCIFGSGGGVAVRVGYLSRSHWYLGGAYGFSEQNSDNLLRLAILQRLQFEAQRYLTRGNRVNPYLVMNAGLALYGNEWAATTWGVVVSSGVGADFEVNEDTLIGLNVVYQPLMLRNWQDAAGTSFADGLGGFGLAQMIAVELTVALQSPLSRF